MTDPREAQWGTVTAALARQHIFHQTREWYQATSVRDLCNQVAAECPPEWTHDDGLGITDALDRLDRVADMAEAILQPEVTA